MSNSFSYSSGRLIGWIATILGLILAIVVGQSVGENDLKLLAIGLAIIIGAVIILGAGRNIWLLIPFCWPLTGRVSILPIPLNVQELAIVAATGTYIFLIVFKYKLYKPRTSGLEIVLLLNLLWIAGVFIRNPVGVKAMGSEMLGGRPYFEILMACCAFWVLTRTLMKPHLARTFPILMAGGSFGASMLGLLTTFVPSLTPLIAPFYSGVDTTAYLRQEFRPDLADNVGRLTVLRGVGIQVANVLISLFRPLTLLNPFRIVPFALFALSFLAIFLSGFRSALIGTAAAFVIASYFWGGLRDCFRAVFLAIAAIMCLVVAQSLGLPIPKPAQRALSFIPAEWDPDAVESAEGTSEWRLDMWQVILRNPDLYLRNPILGSGFGFSAQDLEIQLQAAFGGTGYIGGSQFEAQLITGAYHNGPLSAIRFAGVIGLLLYYALMIAMIRFAFNLAKQSKGTPYFYISVFMATPIIYGIFSYTFIVGSYDSALQDAVFTCAILRCTSDSLAAWKLKHRKADPGPPLGLEPEPSRRTLTPLRFAPRPAAAGSAR